MAKQSKEPRTPNPDPRPPHELSLAEVDAELVSLGDPWDRFESGYIIPHRQAKAEREAAIAACDRRISEAARDEDRGRLVFDREAERIRLLKARREQLLREAADADADASVLAKMDAAASAAAKR